MNTDYRKADMAGNADITKTNADMTKTDVIAAATDIQRSVDCLTMTAYAGLDLCNNQLNPGIGNGPVA